MLSRAQNLAISLAFLALAILAMLALLSPLSALGEGGFTAPTPIIVQHGDKFCLEEFHLDGVDSRLRLVYQTLSGTECPALGTKSTAWTGLRFEALITTSGTQLTYTNGTTVNLVNPKITADAIKTIIDYDKLIAFASAKAR